MQRLNLKITKWLMLSIGVAELALSRIHIKAISLMFERRLGFYMFTFILLGLLMVFLMSSLKKLDASSVFKVSVTSLAASLSAAFCIYFMMTDYQTHDAIKLENFKLSMVLLIVGIVVYLLGTLVIIINSLIRSKEA